MSSPRGGTSMFRTNTNLAPSTPLRFAFSIIIPTFVATIPKGQGFRPTLKVLEGYFPLNLDFPNSQ